MESKTALRRTAFIIAMLLVGVASFALAEDTIEFDGRALSDQEMLDARGGISLPDGMTMAFSLDFLQLKYLGHSDVDAPGAFSYLNALTQNVHVSEDSIDFEMQIVQAMDGVDQNGEGGTSTYLPAGIEQGTAVGDNAGDFPSSGHQNEVAGPGQINDIMIGNSFTNFHGMANANIIAGNYNVGSIVNIFNVRVGFFNTKDLGTVNPLDFVLR